MTIDLRYNSDGPVTLNWFSAQWLRIISQRTLNLHGVPSKVLI
jgi:hypothetical protein